MKYVVILHLVSLVQRRYTQDFDGHWERQSVCFADNLFYQEYLTGCMRHCKGRKGGGSYCWGTSCELMSVLGHGSMDNEVHMLNRLRLAFTTSEDKFVDGTNNRAYQVLLPLQAYIPVGMGMGLQLHHLTHNDLTIKDRQGNVVLQENGIDITATVSVPRDKMPAGVYNLVVIYYRKKGTEHHLWRFPWTDDDITMGVTVLNEFTMVMDDPGYIYAGRRSSITCDTRAKYYTHRSREMRAGFVWSYNANELDQDHHFGHLAYTKEYDDETHDGKQTSTWSNTFDKNAHGDKVACTLLSNYCLEWAKREMTVSVLYGPEALETEIIGDRLQEIDPHKTYPRIYLVPIGKTVRVSCISGPMHPSGTLEWLVDPGNAAKEEDVVEDPNNSPDGIAYTRDLEFSTSRDGPEHGMKVTCIATNTGLQHVAPQYAIAAHTILQKTEILMFINILSPAPLSIESSNSGKWVTENNVKYFIAKINETYTLSCQTNFMNTGDANMTYAVNSLPFKPGRPFVEEITEYLNYTTTTNITFRISDPAWADQSATCQAQNRFDEAQTSTSETHNVIVASGPLHVGVTLFGATANDNVQAVPTDSPEHYVVQAPPSNAEYTLRFTTDYVKPNLEIDCAYSATGAFVEGDKPTDGLQERKKYAFDLYFNLTVELFDDYLVCVFKNKFYGDLNVTRKVLFYNIMFGPTSYSVEATSAVRHEADPQKPDVRKYDVTAGKESSIVFRTGNVIKEANVTVTVLPGLSVVTTNESGEFGGLIYETTLTITPSESDNRREVVYVATNKMESNYTVREVITLEVSFGPSEAVIQYNKTSMRNLSEVFEVTDGASHQMACLSDSANPPSDVTVHIGDTPWLTVDKSFLVSHGGTFSRKDFSLSVDRALNRKKITCTCRNPVSGTSISVESTLDITYGPETVAFFLDGRDRKLGDSVRCHDNQLKTFRCETDDVWPNANLSIPINNPDVIVNEAHVSKNTDGAVQVFKAFTVQAKKELLGLRINCSAINQRNSAMVARGHLTLDVVYGPTTVDLTVSGGDYNERTKWVTVRENQDVELIFTLDDTNPELTNTSVRLLGYNFNFNTTMRRVGKMTEVTKTLRMNRGDNLIPLTFEAENELAQKTVQIVFHIRVAFGPENVIVQLTNAEFSNDNDKIYVVSGKRFSINFTTSTVSPNGTAKIVHDVTGGAFTVTQFGSQSPGAFQSTTLFSATPLAADNNETVQYSVENPYTKAVVKRRYTLVVIFGPSLVAIASNDAAVGRDLWVVEGDRVNLTCRTDTVSESCNVSWTDGTGGLIQEAQLGRQHRVGDAARGYFYEQSMSFTARSIDDGTSKRCNAKNEHHELFSRNESVLVHVLYGPKALNTSVVGDTLQEKAADERHPRIYFAPVRKNIRIRCTSSSIRPLGLLTWTVMPSNAAVVEAEVKRPSNGGNVYTRDLTFTTRRGGLEHGMKANCTARNVHVDKIKTSTNALEKTAELMFVLILSPEPLTFDSHRRGVWTTENSVEYFVAKLDEKYTLSCQTNIMNTGDTSMTYTATSLNPEIHGPSVHEKDEYLNYRTTVNITINITDLATANEEAICRARNPRRPVALEAVSSHYIVVASGPRTVSVELDGVRTKPYWMVLPTQNAGEYSLQASPSNDGLKLIFTTDDVKPTLKVDCTYSAADVFTESAKPQDRILEKTAYTFAVTFTLTQDLFDDYLKCVFSNKYYPEFRITKRINFRHIVFGPSSHTVTTTSAVRHSTYQLQSTTRKYDVIKDEPFTVIFTTTSVRPEANITVTYHPGLHVVSVNKSGEFGGIVYTTSLTYTPSDADNGLVLVYKAINVIDRSYNTRETIRLNVLFGPTDVVLQCDDTRSNLTRIFEVVERARHLLTCLTDSTNPPAATRVYVGGTQWHTIVKEPLIGSNGGKHSQTQFSILVYRRHNKMVISCQTENPGDGATFTASAQSTLDVTYGPDAVAIFQDTGMRIEPSATFDIGLTIPFRCESDDSWPGANISIISDSTKVVVLQDYVVSETDTAVRQARPFTIPMSKDVNGLRITCIAANRRHGAIIANKTFELNVLYGPTSVSLKVANCSYDKASHWVTVHENRQFRLIFTVDDTNPALTLDNVQFAPQNASLLTSDVKKILKSEQENTVVEFELKLTRVANTLSFKFAATNEIFNRTVGMELHLRVAFGPDDVGVNISKARFSDQNKIYAISNQQFFTTYTTTAASPNGTVEIIHDVRGGTYFVSYDKSAIPGAYTSATIFSATPEPADNYESVVYSVKNPQTGKRLSQLHTLVVIFGPSSVGITRNGVVVGRELWVSEGETVTLICTTDSVSESCVISWTSDPAKPIDESLLRNTVREGNEVQGYIFERTLTFTAQNSDDGVSKRCTATNEQNSVFSKDNWLRMFIKFGPTVFDCIYVNAQYDAAARTLTAVENATVSIICTSDQVKPDADAQCHGEPTRQSTSTVTVTKTTTGSAQKVVTVNMSFMAEVPLNKKPLSCSVMNVKAPNKNRSMEVGLDIIFGPAKVKILDAIRVREITRPLWVVRDTRYQFICESDHAYPEVTATWTAGDVAVKSGGVTKITKSSKFFGAVYQTNVKVSVTTALHNKWVKCKLTNAKHAGFTVSAQVQLNVGFGPTRIECITGNGRVDTKPGEVVNFLVRNGTASWIQCSTDGVNEEATVSWTHLPQGLTSWYASNTSLGDLGIEFSANWSFVPLAMHNKRGVTFVAENVRHNRFQASQRLRMTVVFGPLTLTIRDLNTLLKMGNATNMISGQTYSLRCTTDEVSPEVNMTWLKDGQDLGPFPLSSMYGEHQGSIYWATLTFMAGKGYHRNTLACEAKNTKGLPNKVVSRVLLSIIFGPTKQAFNASNGITDLHENTCTFIHQLEPVHVLYLLDDVYPSATVEVTANFARVVYSQTVDHREVTRYIVKIDFRPLPHYNQKLMQFSAINNRNAAFKVSKTMRLQVVFGPYDLNVTDKEDRKIKGLFRVTSGDFHNLRCQSDSLWPEASMTWTNMSTLMSQEEAVTYKNGYDNGLVYHRVLSFTAAPLLNDVQVTCRTVNLRHEKFMEERKIDLDVLFGPNSLSFTSNEQALSPHSSFEHFHESSAYMLSCATDGVNHAVEIRLSTEAPQFGNMTDVSSNASAHGGRRYWKQVRFLAQRDQDGFIVSCNAWNIDNSTLNITKALKLVIVFGPSFLKVDCNNYSVTLNNTVVLHAGSNYTFTCISDAVNPGIIMTWQSLPGMSVGQVEKVTGKKYIYRLSLHFEARPQLNGKSVTCEATNNRNRSRKVERVIRLVVFFGPTQLTFASSWPKLDATGNVMTTMAGKMYRVNCATDSVNPRCIVGWSSPVFLSSLQWDLKGVHGGRNYSSMTSFKAHPEFNSMKFVCYAFNPFHWAVNITRMLTVSVAYGPTMVDIRVNSAIISGTAVNLIHAVVYEVECRTDVTHPKADVAWTLLPGMQLGITKETAKPHGGHGSRYHRSVSFGAKKEWNRKEITCSAININFGELHIKRNITLNVNFGPRNVRLTLFGEPRKFRRGAWLVKRGNDYSVSCQTSNVYPRADVVWNISSGFVGSKTNTTSIAGPYHGKVITSIVLFRARLKGGGVNEIDNVEYSVVCNATNVVSKFWTSQLLKMQVAYGPDILTAHSVRGNTYRINSRSSRLIVINGTSFWLICKTDGAFPGVNIMMEPEYFRLSALQSVKGRFIRNFQRSFKSVANLNLHGRVFTYVAKNTFAPDLQARLEVEIEVIYGPTVVTIEIEGRSNFYLSPDENYTLVCKSDYAYPAVRFEWEPEVIVDVPVRRDKDERGSHAFSSQMLYWVVWGRTIVTCRAINTFTEKLSAFTTVTISNRTDGKWSVWTNWTSCGVTCGEGHALRRRTCTNPAPSAHGYTCPGNDVAIRTCRVGDDCPDWATIFGISLPTATLGFLIFMVAIVLLLVRKGIIKSKFGLFGRETKKSVAVDSLEKVYRHDYPMGKFVDLDFECLPLTAKSSASLHELALMDSYDKLVTCGEIPERSLGLGSPHPSFRLVSAETLEVSDRHASTFETSGSGHLLVPKLHSLQGSSTNEVQGTPNALAFFHDGRRTPSILSWMGSKRKNLSNKRKLGKRAPPKIKKTAVATVGVHLYDVVHGVSRRSGFGKHPVKSKSRRRVGPGFDKIDTKDSEKPLSTATSGKFRGRNARNEISVASVAKSKDKQSLGNKMLSDKSLGSRRRKTPSSVNDDPNGSGLTLDQLSQVGAHECARMAKSYYQKYRLSHKHSFHPLDLTTGNRKRSSKEEQPVETEDSTDKLQHKLSQAQVDIKNDDYIVSGHHEVVTERKVSVGSRQGTFSACAVDFKKCANVSRDSCDDPKQRHSRVISKSGHAKMFQSVERKPSPRRRRHSVVGAKEPALYNSKDKENGEAIQKALDIIEKIKHRRNARGSLHRSSSGSPKRSTPRRDSGKALTGTSQKSLKDGRRGED